MELITNDDQENHDAAQPRRQSNNLVSSQGGDRGRVIVVGSSKIQMGGIIPGEGVQGPHNLPLPLNYIISFKKYVTCKMTREAWSMKS